MTDEDFMRRALALASRAREAGEVPVGAVLVSGNEIAGEGWNRPISASDPTAHAEIQALRAAAAALKSYRLTGSTPYLTLAPCGICPGGLFHARVARGAIGVQDT